MDCGKYNCFTHNVVYGVLFFITHLSHAVVIADIIVYSRSNHSIDTFKSLPAQFGPDLPSQGIKGYAVEAYPPHACDTLVPPPHINSTGLYWFAVIRRGGQQPCSFDIKVQNAERAGYQAAIVYNVGSDDLIPMGGSGVSVSIPSVFIGETSGAIILTRYLYSTKHYLEITDELPFDINQYLLPFIIIIGICFLIMFIFMVIRFVRDYRRRQRSRLSKANLKKLPIKKFKKGETDYDMCAVCLDEYENGDKLRILPCGHAYHAKCIDPWLLKNKRNCPVCKRRVMPGVGGRPGAGGGGSGGDSDSESESDVETERAPLLQSGGGGVSAAGSSLGGYGAAASTSGTTYHTPLTATATASSTDDTTSSDDLYATPSTSMHSPLLSSPRSTTTTITATAPATADRKGKKKKRKRGESRLQQHEQHRGSDTSSCGSTGTESEVAVLTVPLDDSVTVNTAPGDRASQGPQGPHSRSSSNASNESAASGSGSDHRTITSKHNLVI